MDPLPAQDAEDILTTNYGVKPMSVSTTTETPMLSRLLTKEPQDSHDCIEADSVNLVKQHMMFDGDDDSTWKDASMQSAFVAFNDFQFPDMRSVPLEMYLEQVAVLFLEACNVQSAEFMEAVVERYVASALLVNKAELFQSLSRAAYVRGKVDMWKVNPIFRVHPRMVSAQVDEINGRARVFSTNSVIGVVKSRPELTRESVTVISFERRVTREWVIVKFEAIRGPGHWTFEVGHHDEESPISDGCFCEFQS